MFNVGDVVIFESIEAGKHKFHICISLNDHFLYLNSPKKTVYPGDFCFPCSEIPFIEPTPSGVSIISCTTVIRLSKFELTRRKAKKKGSVSVDLMRKLAAFVRKTTTLTEDQKDEFLNSMGEWL
jgi:hypothetical protein